MISILGHTSQSFVEAIHSHLGKGKNHAQILYNEFYKLGKFEGKDPAFKNAPKLFTDICDLTLINPLEVITKLEEHQTGKLLLKTKDGLEIESVILPMKAGWTLCISSQIGCKMGCSFCETAKMGLLRNLSTEEIVSQVFIAIHHFKVPVRNLVFMGMGEPFDNFEEVEQAIKIFTDPLGFHFGGKNITISTSGRVDGMKKLIQSEMSVNLAVSVNAPNDQVRKHLMPVNKMYNMEALKEAMLEYCNILRKKIFIEYVLIRGKNDSIADALDLCNYLEGLNVTVNLIPYNPGRRGTFAPPDQESIQLFQNAMKEKGFLTFVRSTYGQRIMAACGQLGNRQRKTVGIF